MTSELEKIDMLRARTGITYVEAKDVLDAVDGDLVQALIELEEGSRHITEKIQGRSKELMGQLQCCLRRSHRTKIKLTKDDKTVFELPATFGIAALVGAITNNELAVIGAVGAVIALANDYRIEIDSPEEASAWPYR